MLRIPDAGGKVLAVPVAGPKALAVLAASPGAAMERIPAESPISGFAWTVIVPVLLFVVSLAATWALFRHYSRRRP